MNKQELKYIKENYFKVQVQEAGLDMIFEMIDKIKSSGLLTEEQRDIMLKLPIIRLSEKMWGKEGTEDRAIIENLLQKIIGQGGSIRDRIIRVASFVENPPQTTDISEILTYIVLLDTLTNIMLHFNASAAGFTFEGFLAALVGGQQIPAGSQSGIQDIIDNDKVPFSLKLLTEHGGASVEGSYRDLCNHFIDPGDLKQDPESKEYVGKAGAEGTMTYLVVLKSFQEKEAETALTGGEAATIKFYQFDFDAENFLGAMRSNAHNAKLLLLPSDLLDDPSDDPASTHIDSGGEEMDSVDFIHTTFGDDYNFLYAVDKQKLTRIVNKYDIDFVRELFSKMVIIDIEGSKGSRKTLVWKESGKAFNKPQPGTLRQLPWEPPKGSEHLKKVGAIHHEKYLDMRTSIGLLESALAESPDKFWGLIARSLGYAGGISGITQFDINREYYERKSYSVDGLGFIGQIPVGKVAVTNLAQEYVDVLNQQIFDLFEKVELLANQINAYFIGGDKTKGVAAANTAKEIETGQREYMATAGEELAPGAPAVEYAAATPRGGKPRQQRGGLLGGQE
jgi:hypothetical protein